MVDRTRICPGQRSSGDTSLVALNADYIDFAFLSAARYFCVAFSDGDDKAAWVTAILGADSFFPHGSSAEKMRRALSVVQEMRISRKSIFRFSNPRCQTCSAIVTQDEKYLLQLIQAVRKGQISQAASTAMLLCEGNTTEQLIAAAEAFVAEIADVDAGAKGLKRSRVPAMPG
ncbi:MAG: hypothetical protein AAF636_19575 [Pseudomonadota bacterium]